MPVEVGTQFGPYVIAGAVGAGGMGEVYRARDARLDRDVAIKVIPASVARDPDRVARFEREAKAVAALSHPNILTIHDTGTVGETLYVVMELLAGETLGDRLKQGPLPVRKACEVGGLVARGLAAAHDKGLVHRDLKPDNIFLTDDGQVKILDFGLARSTIPPGSTSATRAALTDAGTVLGTVGYMAPEQVRGQVADARADLFALGVVLHEMLSGQRAFARGTAAETMTAILNEDAPDLSLGTRPVPTALERIVRHCLEKNPAERFQTARDVAFALDSLAGSASSGTAVSPDPSTSRRSWERTAWAVATLSLAALAAWLGFNRSLPESGPSEAYRATLLLADGVPLSTSLQPGLRFALSPDGQRLAFIGESGEGSRALWIQTLADKSAVKVEQTEDARGPFWSPDSRTVAFFQDRRLMKVDAAGSRPGVVASVHGSGTWSVDGQTILVADQQDGVRAVSAVDGAVRVLVPPRIGFLRFFPLFLPEDRRIMFGEYPSGVAAGYGWYGSDLDGAPPARLFSGSIDRDRTNLQMASGHVLWARDQNLLARPLSQLLETSGSEPLVIAGPVEGVPRASAAFSVSQTGVLVYQLSVNANRSRLVWFDRSGTRLGQLGADGDYSNLEASADGARLLVSLTDGATPARDIWVLDINRGVPTRVTFDPADERSAAWSTDGRSIIYRGQGGELYTRPLGSGEAQPFLIDTRSKDPRGWSADGRFFLYRATGNGNDLWIKPSDPGAAPYPFIATPFAETYGEFSPDGQWLAYVSNESAASEVYVTAFPSGQGKTRVSSNGGNFPRWRGDGRELYYLSADNTMMVAAVSVSASGFQVGASTALFQTTVKPGPGTPYIVSQDGRRFLINSTIPSTDPPSLSVVFNWPALTRKK
jgi:serine/threonine protein kinase